MTQSHSAVDAIATAKSVLLTPWGLTESDLQHSLAEIFAHRVDYADLYFQYSRSEGWSLEEGIVKTGSFNIEQGVGVRAISGEKTAFSYSDALSKEALLGSAHAVRTIARHGQNASVPTLVARQMERPSLYIPNDPLDSLTAPQKVALLEKVEKMARAKDPRVSQVMASLGATCDTVLVVGSDGRLAADIRPLVRLSVTVIVEQNGRRETGSFGGGGRFDLGYFDEAILQYYVDEAVQQALTNLEAKDAPAGEMP